MLFRSVDAVQRVERGIAYTFRSSTQPTSEQLTRVAPLLHDRMTEAPASDLALLFAQIAPQPLVRIPVLAEGRGALERANSDMGLALVLPGGTDAFSHGINDLETHIVAGTIVLRPGVTESNQDAEASSHGVFLSGEPAHWSF